ncbi:MAG: type I glyceraldehyde-3-phosphate dehydrogenase [Candidatus Pacebacteria bacterium]|nr:type I glyceraldehyde-3-phosphate dehydrogenase [Candidatus Paceibacterota bacterium]
MKIAINGFGRIGRAVFKIILKKYPDLELVAINDLSDSTVLAHLLRYDSLYGTYENRAKADNDTIFIDGTSTGRKVALFSERDPENLPWKKMGIDIVLECTGIFRDYDGANKHIKAGAKKVIISAPSKSPEKIASYIIGVNENEIDYSSDIFDIGSCTTNCLAPILNILNNNYGVEKGFITTIHSYTNDQKLLDISHSDLRRARAAAINIIPTSTGAAKAIGRVIPSLEGKIDGISLRVPTPTVSLLDLFCELKEGTTKEDLNYIFKKSSLEEKYSGILGVEDAPLVSSDYVGSSFSSIIDSSLTMANKKLVKVVSWYDNEWGYSCRLADFTNLISNKI